MILWINGAFGAGKTQTAYELNRRIPDSYVYDPENVGYFIQKNMPKTIRLDDFQNYPMWRDINFHMLAHLNEEYDGVIIVPMTIVNRDYFQETIGRLRETGVAVHHFTLCASKDTLKKRLKKRGERANSWPEQQIDRCLTALTDSVFQHHMDTDRMNISENAEYIAAVSEVSLLPDHRGKLRKSYDRIITQIKHIRF